VNEEKEEKLTPAFDDEEGVAGCSKLVIVFERIGAVWEQYLGENSSDVVASWQHSATSV
jgi:hypothetical protein